MDSRCYRAHTKPFKLKFYGEIRERNIMIRKIIGGLLIFIIFIVLFLVTVIEKGFGAAIIAWGISLVLIFIFVVAMRLIFDEI